MTQTLSVHFNLVVLAATHAWFRDVSHLFFIIIRDWNMPRVLQLLNSLSHKDIVDEECARFSWRREDGESGFLSLEVVSLYNMSLIGV